LTFDITDIAAASTADAAAATLCLKNITFVFENKWSISNPIMVVFGSVATETTCH